MQIQLAIPFGTSVTASLAPLASRLASHLRLTSEDIDAILAMKHFARTFSENTYLVKEGYKARPYFSFVVSGIAFRSKVSSTGDRQITALNFPGEIINLDHLFFDRADHSVQALTKLRIVDIDGSSLRKIIRERPAVAHALWLESMVADAMSREWLVNVGVRPGRTRIAHLLCELFLRMRAAGMIENAPFFLPMTQAQLGDSTALTSVHVNRTIKALGEEGVIQHSGRAYSITDWIALCQIGEFDPSYLHLENLRTVDFPAARQSTSSQREITADPQFGSAAVDMNPAFVRLGSA